MLPRPPTHSVKERQKDGKMRPKVPLGFRTMLYAWDWPVLERIHRHRTESEKSLPQKYVDAGLSQLCFRCNTSADETPLHTIRDCPQAKPLYDRISARRVEILRRTSMQYELEQLASPEPDDGFRPSTDVVARIACDLFATNVQFKENARQELKDTAMEGLYALWKSRNAALQDRMHRPP